MVARVVIYTKEGCHLCENVILQLQKLQTERSFELLTRDITENTEAYERFKNSIPVVEIDGKIRLGGTTLANRSSLEEVLRKALTDSEPYR